MNIFCLLGYHKSKVTTKFYPSLFSDIVVKVEVISQCLNCPRKTYEIWKFDDLTGQHIPNPKVIFEKLPKENPIVIIWRFIFRKPRKYEYIRLSLNLFEKVIKRGVIVELPREYLEIADHAPERFKYGYKIIQK